MKQEAESGWQNFFHIVAFLSIVLGVMNLIPLPVVDGGEMVFCLFEGILGRRVRVKTYMFLKQAGMLFLLALMAFVIWNDAAKLIKEWLYPQIL